MNGAMAGIAVLIAVAGVLAFNVRGHVTAPGRKALCERVAAGFFGLAAFAGMVAFAPSLAVLWQVTGTGAGLVVLAVLIAATGFFGFLMVGRGKGHHHHGSIAVAGIFGVTMALAIGGWHQISRSAGQAVASAGQAAGGVVTGGTLTQSSADNHQALAAASTGGGRVAVIAALIVLAVALVVFLRGYRKSSRAAAPRRAPRGGGGRPGPSPLPGPGNGRPGAPLPAGGDSR